MYTGEDLNNQTTTILNDISRIAVIAYNKVNNELIKEDLKILSPDARNIAEFEEQSEHLKDMVSNIFRKFFKL